MIPVERYAARTARIAAIGTELMSLDQAWTALSEEFAGVLFMLRQMHEADTAASQHLAQLVALDLSLAALEIAAIRTMSSAHAKLAEVCGD